MVTRDTAWASGTPCWVDLGVADIPKAGAFYAALFGWEVQPGPPEAGGYALCLAGGRQVAGIGPAMGPLDAPPSWTTYLAASDVAATAAKITEAGGQVLVPPMDVLALGRMALARDPGGAAFGLWQAGSHTGFQRANEPGSVSWNENLSRDLTGNKDFYQAVFGYEYGDIGAGLRYSTLKIGGTEVGGIGELDASLGGDTPAHWSVYFTVTDTDAAVSRAGELGGHTVRPCWDTPYGRMAVVADDHGAAFSLISAGPVEPG